GQPFFGTYPFKGDLLLGYLSQGLVAIGLVLLALRDEPLALLALAPIWVLRFFLDKVVELREMNEQLVQSFADALDMRDHDTAGHTRRVAAMARMIARHMGLSRRQQDDVYAAGSLHDLGKIGIRDAVLLKPGSLEPEEWEEMKQHPLLGASLLAPYRHLREVTLIMRHHHEHFDGSGYPDGLAGEAIPMGARIISVADAFMVITAGRGYRAPRSVSEAIVEIRRCSGVQFDPSVVDAFLALDPARLLGEIETVDPRDQRPVFDAIAPRPVWQKLLNFKAA
ncbi:MAG: HD domain-containing protein, partial [Chloroflexi bacterium]|nr:HD domain-containing protein [Chloroflexota bacterium]